MGRRRDSVLTAGLFLQRADGYDSGVEFNTMVEQPSSSRLADILKAATGPTRRAILTLLAQEGPTRVTEIAAHFDTSLNAVSKHIKVLKAAGLVSCRTLWRAHAIAVQLEPLAEIDRWFQDLRSIWAKRPEALGTVLSGEGVMTDLALTVTRLINVPIDRAFNAWLDSGLLARFMTPGEGMTVPHCTTDPRIGGRFAITMKAGNQEIPHAGTYAEITRTRASRSLGNRHIRSTGVS